MTSSCPGLTYIFAFPRRDAPGLCRKFSPIEGVALPQEGSGATLKEGAGNAGCPLHPQPVCIGRKHTVVTTVAPGSPGIPARNGFNGL